MNNNEILKVVGINVPNGSGCLGSKVKLSNGKYLGGIRSITLHADIDTKQWQLTLETIPHFVDQKTIEAVLVNIEQVKRESTPHRIRIIENQIIDLQNELKWLISNE